MRVRQGYGTVLSADPAAGAFFFIHVARLLLHLDAEIPGPARDFLDLSPGDDPDVGRPTGLYQLWRQDSDSAVIGGKGFIQPGHDAADGSGSLDQVDKITCIGKIHGCLDSSDPATDNHYRANGFFWWCVTLQWKLIPLFFVLL
jgi:hypothetical protein